MTADELGRLIEAGETERAEHAVRADPALVAGRTTDGETPLHVACRTKMVGVVTALVAAKAALDARDARGRTPLHSAVLGGGSLGPTLVDFLLTFGADASAIDDNGQSVEDLARTEQVLGLDSIIERLHRS